jgi:hypothetical protein
MFAAGYGSKGQSHLYVVKPEAGVNAEYFIEYILSSMMLEDVYRLYGTDADNIILYMDSARSIRSRMVFK